MYNFPLLVFCHDNTIKYLFFQCKLARSIWSVIQIASGLYPPCSVANVFGNWLHGIDHRFRTLLRVGALAVIWSLWLCRNDKVFNDKSTSLMQVIYRCTGTLRLWSSLQRVENRDLFTEVCTRLEATAGILLPNMADLRIAPSALSVIRTLQVFLVFRLFFE